MYLHDMNPSPLFLLYLSKDMWINGASNLNKDGSKPEYMLT